MRQIFPKYLYYIININRHKNLKLTYFVNFSRFCLRRVLAGKDRNNYWYNLKEPFNFCLIVKKTYSLYALKEKLKRTLSTHNLFYLIQFI
ncbi:hypothetical protein EZS27_027889 [termite gut metagenome]|uniref:Uncharacterized protein n=1 Tax=termite gut metagenome TaxID=433724 RepID=A0A5J4QL34_9ZZZZ